MPDETAKDIKYYLTAMSGACGLKVLSVLCDTNLRCRSVRKSAFTIGVVLSCFDSALIFYIVALIIVVVLLIHTAFYWAMQVIKAFVF